jgi:hypothetical protein
MYMYRFNHMPRSHYEWNLGCPERQQRPAHAVCPVLFSIFNLISVLLLCTRIDISIEISVSVWIAISRSLLGWTCSQLMFTPVVASLTRNFGILWTCWTILGISRTSRMPSTWPFSYGQLYCVGEWRVASIQYKRHHLGYARILSRTQFPNSCFVLGFRVKYACSGQEASSMAV